MATMAMALQATKLTMMAMTTTMATGDDNGNGNGATGNDDDDGDSTTGDDDDNGDGATGNGATGYNNDGNR